MNNVGKVKSTSLGSSSLLSNFALMVSPGVGTGVGVGEAARVEHD